MIEFQRLIRVVVSCPQGHTAWAELVDAPHKIEVDRKSFSCSCGARMDGQRPWTITLDLAPVG